MTTGALAKRNQKNPDSFNVVHCCQVTELLASLENQSDMESRSFVDDVHDDCFPVHLPVTRIILKMVSKLLGTRHLHKSDCSGPSSHQITVVTVKFLATMSRRGVCIKKDTQHQTFVRMSQIGMNTSST